MAHGPATKTVAIRPADLTDAGVLAVLHAACFGQPYSAKTQSPWSQDAMAQFIAGPGTVCRIASAGADPAGFLIARATLDEAELLTIGVLPEHRRRHIGRALLDDAVAALRPIGVRRLFLEVDQNNAAALGLYQALGATKVGQRPRYYENGADAAILSLDLGA